MNTQQRRKTKNEKLGRRVVKTTVWLDHLNTNAKKIEKMKMPKRLAQAGTLTQSSIKFYFIRI